MPTILEVYNDQNGQQLYAIDRLYGLPAFVKSAELTADISELPSSVFADAMHRKLPCHTKAAAWLSQAYFLLNKGSYKQAEARIVQDNLDKHATYWKIRGLSESLKHAWEKMASADRAAVKDEDYGLIVKVAETGETIKRFPMPNAISVKHAAEYLYANRAQYPYEWRRTAARSILKKMAFYDDQFRKGKDVPGHVVMESGPSLALRLNPDTQEYIERAAGYGVTMPNKIAQAMEVRASALGALTRVKGLTGGKAKAPKEPFKKGFKKLSEFLSTAELPDLKMLHKLASVIDELDRETGLNALYTEGLKMPEEICFDMLEKEASAIKGAFVPMTTGSVYPIDAFKQIPLAKLAEVMGDGFVTAVSTDGKLSETKVAEIVPTLPRGDAVLLEEALNAASVSAVAR